MSKKPNNSVTTSWVDGELRLVGALDSRMIGLLRAIEQSGSINQAAKQTGLSYKGAWQMIERANNLAPKVLIPQLPAAARWRHSINLRRIIVAATVYPTGAAA